MATSFRRRRSTASQRDRDQGAEEGAARGRVPGGELIELRFQPLEEALARRGQPEVTGDERAQPEMPREIRQGVAEAPSGGDAPEESGWCRNVEVPAMP